MPRRFMGGWPSTSSQAASSSACTRAGNRYGQGERRREARVLQRALATAHRRRAQRTTRQSREVARRVRLASSRERGRDVPRRERNDDDRVPRPECRVVPGRVSDRAARRRPPACGEGGMSRSPIRARGDLEYGEHAKRPDVRAEESLEDEGRRPAVRQMRRFQARNYVRRFASNLQECREGAEGVLDYYALPTGHYA